MSFLDGSLAVRVFLVVLSFTCYFISKKSKRKKLSLSLALSLSVFSILLFVFPNLVPVQVDSELLKATDVESMENLPTIYKYQSQTNTINLISEIEPDFDACEVEFVFYGSFSSDSANESLTVLSKESADFVGGNYHEYLFYIVNEDTREVVNTYSHSSSEPISDTEIHILASSTNDIAKILILRHYNFLTGEKEQSYLYLLEFEDNNWISKPFDIPSYESSFIGNTNTLLSFDEKTNILTATEFWFSGFNETTLETSIVGITQYKLDDNSLNFNIYHENLDTSTFNNDVFELIKCIDFNKEISPVFEMFKNYFDNDDDFINEFQLKYSDYLNLDYVSSGNYTNSNRDELLAVFSITSFNHTFEQSNTKLLIIVDANTKELLYQEVFVSDEISINFINTDNLPNNTILILSLSTLNKFPFNTYYNLDFISFEDGKFVDINLPLEENAYFKYSFDPTFNIITATEFILKYTEMQFSVVIDGKTTSYYLDELTYN